MAKNQKYSNALHIALPVPEGTKSGDPVKVGTIAGVAQIDRQPNGKASVWLDASHLIPVAGAVANVGDPVYFKADTRTLHATAVAGSTFWGAALATKAGAAVAPLEVVPAGYTAPTAAAV